MMTDFEDRMPQPPPTWRQRLGLALVCVMTALSAGLTLIDIWRRLFG